MMLKSKRFLIKPGIFGSQFLATSDSSINDRYETIVLVDAWVVYFCSFSNSFEKPMCFELIVR